MASVSLICPVRIASFTREGTFLSAHRRLSQLCALGADAVVLTQFDDRAGTSEQLSSLCRRARLLSLTVLLDVRCLYGGVSSPAALIDTAVRQGVCDGFLLSGAEWRYPDVREVVLRLGKELPGTCFVLSDVPPDKGERPDGALRAIPSPEGLLMPDADPAAAFTAALSGTRHALLCPVTDAHSDARRADATLLLAYLLPGVPMIPTDSYTAVPSVPTDDECAAHARRMALWERVRAIRREHPTLAHPQGTALTVQGGLVTLTRRLKEGTFTLALSQGDDVPVTERSLQSTPPLLSYGMYRAQGALRLLSYGYALSYIPKVQKPPKAINVVETANNDSQNMQETAATYVTAGEENHGENEDQSHQ